jgi:hypothetical protein
MTRLTERSRRVSRFAFRVWDATALKLSWRAMQRSPLYGLAVLVLLSLVACKEQALEDTPDADIKCAAGAHVFCGPTAAPGEGCTITGAETDARLKQIAPGTYPLACVANFVSPVRDVGGDCRVDAICRCQVGDDASVQTAWHCFP